MRFADRPPHGRADRRRGARALGPPQFGLLAPDAFLPLAEQTGLMRPLTLRVLDDALAQCARWRDEGLPLGVAVNLGAPNLLDLGLPKIDKSFILGMDEDAEAAMIVHTIIELAHNLGLRAVGEGIETEQARSLLIDSGCDYGQGFLMGRPMPADELTARAKERAAVRA